MKSIPIFHPVSMSAGEGCRYCRRRRELCGKCFLGRTTDRARLRPRIASLPARTARVVHPPFGPSNIPPLTSWASLSQWTRSTPHPLRERTSFRRSARCRARTLTKRVMQPHYAKAETSHWDQWEHLRKSGTGYVTSCSKTADPPVCYSLQIESRCFEPLRSLRGSFQAVPQGTIRRGRNHRLQRMPHRPKYSTNHRLA
jgi:hypothetical protein